MSCNTTDVTWTGTKYEQNLGPITNSDCHIQHTLLLIKKSCILCEAKRPLYNNSMCKYM